MAFGVNWKDSMNKAELIEALAVRFDGNKAEAARALAAVIETVTEQTAKGEKVSITGFGIFEKAHRAARMVRNPRTGERKEAPAVDVPRFRAGSEFKAAVAAPVKKEPAKKAAPAKKEASAKKAPAKKEAPAKKAPAKKAAK